MLKLSYLGPNQHCFQKMLVTNLMLVCKFSDYYSFSLESNYYLFIHAGFLESLHLLHFYLSPVSSPLYQCESNTIYSICFLR